MVDNHNLTVHTYNEELALEIFKNIPLYYQLLREWTNRIRNNIS